MSKAQRVESLVYKLNSAEGVAYEDPPPLEVDQETWKGRLENGVLTCHMKPDFGSVSDARKEVERYLRAWEIHAGIAYGRGSLRFVHQDAVMVDTSSGGEGDARICLTARGFVTTRTVVTATARHSRYPPTPDMFAVSPDVEALWTRYERYLDGKEPLLGMANYCLTKIEASYGQGNREVAASTIKVNYRILNTLGHLASARGDNVEARKVPKRDALQPLSRAERNWIQTVVKVLIRRAGEYAGCDDSSTLDRIDMQDLPPLA